MPEETPGELTEKDKLIEQLTAFAAREFPDVRKAWLDRYIAWLAEETLTVGLPQTPHPKYIPPVSPPSWKPSDVSRITDAYNALLTEARSIIPQGEAAPKIPVPQRMIPQEFEDALRTNPEYQFPLPIVGVRDKLYFVKDPREYFQRMTGLGGLTVGPGDPSPYGKITREIADAWVDEGVLGVVGVPAGYTGSAGLEADDVVRLMQMDIPASTIWYDYRLSIRAVEYLGGALKAQGLMPGVSMPVRSASIPPEQRVAAPPAIPPQLGPGVGGGPEAVQPRIEGVPGPGEEGYDLETWGHAQVAAWQEAQKAPEEVKHPTGIDDIDLWIAPLVKGWPRQAREEYRIYAEDYVNEMYYQYAAGGGTAVSLDVLLADLPLPDLSYIQASRIAALANPPKWVDTDFLNAVAQTKGNSFPGYSIVDLYTQAQAELSREKRLKAWTDLGPELGKEPQPITLDEIALRAQQNANQYVLDYQGQLQEAGSWDEFTRLRERNAPIDQYIPPFGFGIPAAASFTSPLLNYIEKSRAREEGRAYDPRDAYLRIEQDMIREGLSPPDPAQMTEAEYRDAQWQWQYDVAGRSQAQSLQYLADNPEFAASLPPMPSPMFAPTPKAAAALVGAPGAAQRIAQREGTARQDAAGEKEYSAWLRANFPDIEDRARLESWFTQVYGDYEAQAQKLVGEEPSTRFGGMIKREAGWELVQVSEYDRLKALWEAWSQPTAMRDPWTGYAIMGKEYRGEALEPGWEKRIAIQFGGYQGTAGKKTYKTQPFGSYLGELGKGFFEKLLPPKPTAKLPEYTVPKVRFV